ncbi:hypothetical protein DEA8626_03711 [Defluviimonas aquaemixtae]|uniref:Peptidase inhibitor I78 family protein n=1 Tax=Albidovulum aquaemixtae TaxID=1542388 RepID=A0A2R8BML3_9RHOB|nr:I78 family peptidase inhibitor [Defluviimonas aquaemixtae]SPH24660.1 hypothetical protein DEA8626_03711 [Defluviimonas aquaemixtae]
MRIDWTFLAVATLGLGACVATVEPEPGPGSGADACGAADLQFMVGQSEDILAAMTFPAPMRVIHPGQAVTMDYNPKRLNIEIDGVGRIARVRCG